MNLLSQVKLTGKTIPCEINLFVKVSLRPYMETWQKKNFDFLSKVADLNPASLLLQLH